MIMHPYSRPGEPAALLPAMSAVSRAYASAFLGLAIVEELELTGTPTPKRNHGIPVAEIIKEANERTK